MPYNNETTASTHYISVQEYNRTKGCLQDFENIHMTEKL